jgi:hypothetical protein
MGPERGFYEGRQRTKQTTARTAANFVNMVYALPLLVVGCICLFALCTQQGIGLGCAKGQ